MATFDNRDLYTTDVGDHLGHTIEVDPVSLMRNALENLPEPFDKKYVKRFNDMINDILREVED